MRKALLVMAGGLLASGSLAIAQPAAPLDLEVLFTGTDVNTLVGSPSNSEFDGVAVKADGSVVYLFDSTGTFDGILSYASGTPAVFATEFQLSPVTNGASANDFDTDAAGNLYANVYTNTSNTQAVWMIPEAGFGGAVAMLSGAALENVDEIEVDDANSRLLMTYSDLFGTVDENIVAIPLTASAETTPTVVVTETAMEAALATLTGYVDDAGDDLNVTDFTVQSDGDIIIAHGFSSNRQINGSILISDSTGSSVSVFISADDLITAAGGTPATDDIGNVGVEALSTDEILVHVPFVTSTTVPPEDALVGFIGVLSADGSSFTKLATYSEINDDPIAAAPLVPTGESLMENATRHVMDSKNGGDVDGNDDYYFYRQGSASPAENAVIKLSGIRAFLDGPSSVKNWTMY
ncbi:MAG: hypothetical protein PWP23_59 [Candidatus Sumerlaeota bacterium]|nr:hypothetical protein [Candidatus Sumerlaeota bacterium]